MLYNLSSHLLSRITLPFLGLKKGEAEGPRRGWNFSGTFPTHPQQRLMHASESAKIPAVKQKMLSLHVWAGQVAPMEWKVFSLFSGPHAACQRWLQSRDHLSDSPLPLPCPDTIWDFFWKLKQSFAMWKPAHLGLCCPQFINKEGFLHPPVYKGPF